MSEMISVFSFFGPHPYLVGAETFLSVSLLSDRGQKVTRAGVAQPHPSCPIP